LLSGRRPQSEGEKRRELHLFTFPKVKDATGGMSGEDFNGEEAKSIGYQILFFGAKS